MISPKEYSALTAMDAAYLQGVRQHQDEMRAKYTSGTPELGARK